MPLSEDISHNLKHSSVLNQTSHLLVFGATDPFISISKQFFSVCLLFQTERDEFPTGFSFRLPISTTALAEQVNQWKCPLSFVLHRDLEFTQY